MVLTSGLEEAVRSGRASGSNHTVFGDLFLSTLPSPLSEGSS